MAANLPYPYNIVLYVLVAFLSSLVAIILLLGAFYLIQVNYHKRKQKRESDVIQDINSSQNIQSNALTNTTIEDSQQYLLRFLTISRTNSHPRQRSKKNKQKNSLSFFGQYLGMVNKWQNNKQNTDIENGAGKDKSFLSTQKHIDDSQTLESLDNNSKDPAASDKSQHQAQPQPQVQLRMERHMQGGVSGITRSQQSGQQASQQASQQNSQQISNTSRQQLQSEPSIRGTQSSSNANTGQKIQSAHILPSDSKLLTLSTVNDSNSTNKEKKLNSSKAGRAEQILLSSLENKDSGSKQFLTSIQEVFNGQRASQDPLSNDDVPLRSKYGVQSVNNKYMNTGSTKDRTLQEQRTMGSTNKDLYAEMMGTTNSWNSQVKHQHTTTKTEDLLSNETSDKILGIKSDQRPQQYQQQAKSNSYNDASGERTKNSSVGKSNSTLDVGIPFNFQLPQNQQSIQQQASLSKEQLRNQVVNGLNPQLSNVILPYPDEAFNVSQSQASLQNVLQSESEKRFSRAANEVSNKNYDEEFSLSKVSQTQMSNEWSLQDRGSYNMSMAAFKGPSINDGNLLYNVDEEISLRSTKQDLLSSEPDRISSKDTNMFVQKSPNKGSQRGEDSQSGMSDLQSFLKSSTNYQDQFQDGIKINGVETPTSTSFDQHLKNKDLSVKGSVLGAETSPYSDVSNQITNTNTNTDHNVHSEIPETYRRKSSFQTAINQSNNSPQMVGLDSSGSFVDALTQEEAMPENKPPYLSSQSTYQPIPLDQGQSIISRSNKFVKQSIKDSDMVNEKQLSQQQDSSEQLARNLSGLSSSLTSNHDDSQIKHSLAEQTPSKTPKGIINNLFQSGDFTPTTTFNPHSSIPQLEVDKSPYRQILGSQQDGKGNVNTLNIITQDPRQTSLTDVFKSLSTFNFDDKPAIQEDNLKFQELNQEPEQTSVHYDDSSMNFDLQDSMQVVNNSKASKSEASDSRSYEQKSLGRGSFKSNSQQISGYRDINNSTLASLNKFQLSKDPAKQFVDQPHQSDIDTVSSEGNETSHQISLSQNQSPGPASYMDIQSPQPSFREVDIQKEDSTLTQFKGYSSTGVQVDLEYQSSGLTLCEIDINAVNRGKRSVGTQFIGKKESNLPKLRLIQDSLQVARSTSPMEPNFSRDESKDSNSMSQSATLYPGSVQGNSSSQVFNQSISLRNQGSFVSQGRGAAKSDFDSFHQQLQSSHLNPIISQQIYVDQPQGSTTGSPMNVRSKRMAELDSNEQHQSQESIRQSKQQEDSRQKQQQQQIQGTKTGVSHQESDQKINDLLNNVSELNTESLGSQIYSVSRPTASQIQPSTEFSNMKGFLTDPFEGKNYPGSSKEQRSSQVGGSSNQNDGSNTQSTSIKVSNMYYSHDNSTPPQNPEGEQDQRSKNEKFEEIQYVQPQSSDSLDFQSAFDGSYRTMASYQVSSQAKRVPSSSHLSVKSLNKQGSNKGSNNDNEDRQSFKSFDSVENSIGQARSNVSIYQSNEDINKLSPSQVQQPKLNKTDFTRDSGIPLPKSLEDLRNQEKTNPNIQQTEKHIQNKKDIFDTQKSNKITSDSNSFRENVDDSVESHSQFSSQGLSQAQSQHTNRDLGVGQQEYLTINQIGKQSSLASKGRQSTIQDNVSIDKPLQSNQTSIDLRTQITLAVQGFNDVRSTETRNEQGKLQSAVKSSPQKQGSGITSQLFRSETQLGDNLRNNSQSQQQMLDTFYKNHSMQKSGGTISSVSSSQNRQINTQEQEAMSPSSNTRPQSRIEQLLQQQADYQHQKFNKQANVDNTVNTMDTISDLSMENQAQKYRPLEHQYSRLQQQANKQVQREPSIMDGSSPMNTHHNSTLYPEKSVQISYSVMTEDEEPISQFNEQSHISKQSQSDATSSRIQHSLSGLTNQPSFNLVKEAKAVGRLKNQIQQNRKASQLGSNHSLYSNALYDESSLQQQQLRSGQLHTSGDLEDQSQIMESQQLLKSGQNELLSSNNLQPDYFKDISPHRNFVSDVYETDSQQYQYKKPEKVDYFKQQEVPGYKNQQLRFDKLKSEQLRSDNLQSDQLRSDQMTLDNDLDSSVNPSFLHNSHVGENNQLKLFGPKERHVFSQGINTQSSNQLQTRPNENIMSTNIVISNLDPQLLPRFNRKASEQNLKTKDGTLESRNALQSNVQTKKTPTTLTSQVLNPLEQLNTLFNQDKESLRSFNNTLADSTNHSMQSDSPREKKSRGNDSFRQQMSGKHSSHNLNSRVQKDAPTNIEQVVAQFDVPKQMPDSIIFQSNTGISQVPSNSEDLTSEVNNSQLSILQSQSNVENLLKAKSSIHKSLKNIKFEGMGQGRGLQEITDHDVYTIWDVNDLNDIEKQIKSAPKDHNAGMIQAMMQRISQKKQEISSQLAPSLNRKSRELSSRQDSPSARF